MDSKTSIMASFKAIVILGLATASTMAQTYKPLVYKGCYISAGDLTSAGSDMYQSPGLCQETCVKQGHAVMATTKGSDCYCGDLLPPEDQQASDSSCSTKCNGFGEMMCGGPKAWSVQLTGTKNSVGTSGGSSSESDSTDTTSEVTPEPATSEVASPPSETPTPEPETTPAQSPTHTKGSSPSVVTHASTIVVTAPGQTQATTTVITSIEETNKKKGPNVAGIAAGVVVGVVALLAIAGVLFFVIRTRRRRAIEEQHRNSLGPSWYGTNNVTSSSNSISDSRLEPSVMMQRRQSDVSIEDNQDYSRRILKVTNPDGS